MGTLDCGLLIVDSASCSSNSPAGRTARSTCQSAVRRSFVNALSAPMSASVVSSSRRRLVRCTTCSIESNRPAGRSSTDQSCEQMLQ
jgi:hypothetical protein